MKKARLYVDLIKSKHVDVKEAYLFGSYAKGNQHKWSDIDLLIVTDDFEGGYEARKFMRKEKQENIELHSLTTEEFSDAWDEFSHEIKKTGIKIL